MSASAGSEALYAIFAFGLIAASQLDRIGYFSSTSSASSLAVKEVAVHHTGHAASAVPTPLPVSFEDISSFVSCPEFIFAILAVGTVVGLILYCIFGSKNDDIENHQQLGEAKLNRHQEWIDDHDWLDRRLKEQRDEIWTLTAELHTHRKMLKVLKQMPSYQVEAAAIAVSAAVKDSKAARDMTESLKKSAPSEPAWEQESEVNDGN